MSDAAAVNMPAPNAAPVEAPAEANKPVEAKPDPNSAKWAQMARKEKQLREQIKSIEAREQAWQQKESEYTEARSLKERLLQQPIQVLQELGVGWDKLTEAVLNQPSPEDLKLQELRKEIESLKGQQTAAEKRAQQQQEQAYETAVTQIRNDVKMLVDSDPEFETIKSLDAVEDVVELIKDTYNKEQRLLSIEEAAKIIENDFVEQAMRIASINKIKSKLNPAQVAALEAETKPEGMQQKPSSVAPMKTLTNAQSPQSSKPLTAAQKRERAIAIFKGQVT